MNTKELIEYYQNLLIKQYNGLPNANGTIATTVTPVVMPQESEQLISFGAAPDAGSFILNYGGVQTASIAWNDSAASIQTKLRAITGLEAVTVTGAIADLSLTINFVGVTPVAEILEVESNTLQSGGDDVSTNVTEIDETLPLAVQNGFNLTGDNIAVGDQLDTLGKYVGVSRNGYVLNQPVTLSDADFLVIIKLAIAQNYSGSSLYDIVNNLYQFFGLDIIVVDTKLMRLDYFIDSDIGSKELILFALNAGLIPKPMGVGLLVIFAPDIDFFGFRTYLAPAGATTRPFNSYADYHTDWPWFSYDDVLI